MDLVMGELGISPERTEIMDFTVAFQTYFVYIETKIPNFNDSTLFSMFKPLSLEVWIAILVSLITGISVRAQTIFKLSQLLFPYLKL